MRRCVLFLVLFPGLLLAQPAPESEELAEQVGLETAAPPTLEDLTTRLSLQEIIDNGGWPVYLLGVMSVVGFALVVYFLFTLRRGRIAPVRWVRDLQEKLQAGNLEHVREMCEDARTPISALVVSALDYLDRAGEDADPELLRQVVEGEGVRQVGRLQSQVTYLMDIGVIAPMVGLLGTVMGMLKSFSSVALDIAKVKPMVLANGVSQALITTAAGLVVAIPAMMCYSLFRGRLNKLTGNLEMVAADLVTTLVHRKSE